MLAHVIRSWADAETQRLYERERSRRFPPDMQPVALRKLKMLKLRHGSMIFSCRRATGSRN
jgi:plasmid maintenance system killer protein